VTIFGIGFPTKLTVSFLENEIGILDHFKTLEPTDAHVDFPTCLIFDKLYELFPDAKFINITRPESEWVSSMTKMKNHYIKFYGNDTHAKKYFKKDIEPMDEDEYNIGNIPNHLRFLKKIKKFREYKFVLVIENQKIFSYVSEKLIDSMASGSLPIYYGFEDIDKFFPDIFDNAVINGFRYSNDEIFKLIKNMTDDEWLMRINNIEKIIKKYLIFFTETTSLKYMLYVILKNYKLYDDNMKLLEHIQNTCIITLG
jgi:uncharacterized protein YjgD (DUF1641 family)